MICTGTGSAPFRAFTERRRGAPCRTRSGASIMFFGARTPEELPYFGPLQKVPRPPARASIFAILALPGATKEYVQDRMREKAEELAGLLRAAKTHVYICGLKGMETGVDEAFADHLRQAPGSTGRRSRRDARAAAAITSRRIEAHASGATASCWKSPQACAAPAATSAG